MNTCFQISPTKCAILAEEVLNADMLNLMEAYQQHLGSKGSVLDGAIELLKNTSVLIDIFRYRRPANESNDIRFTKLHAVQQWFLNWQCKVTKNQNHTRSVLQS